MIIYLCGSCGSTERTRMVKVAELLRSLGYDVYCPFELQIPNAWDISQEDWAKKVFKADIQAILHSDIFLFISVGRVSTAGSNWELGYAYAREIPTYVFQITDAQTSLMTYWGCDNFVNTSEENLEKDLRAVFEKECRPYHTKCKTILT